MKKIWRWIMRVLLGVGSKGKNISNMFVGVNNGAKRVKKGYIGVDGKAKVFFQFTPPSLSLAGGQKYENDYIWPAGRYQIELAAGSSYYYRAAYAASGISYSEINKSVPGGKIVQTITVNTQFIIRAYTGTRGTKTAAGVNPYSGTFKVNGLNTRSSVPDVSHIFGNAGSVSGADGQHIMCSSGNSLGNGAYYKSPYAVESSNSTGAGTVLHLMPVGGTFGKDYLFAFHVTAPSANGAAGCGSAYGGAGAGGKSDSVLPLNGGNTPYGTGGVVPSGWNKAYGISGNGVGAGVGAAVIVPATGEWTPGRPVGAAAWFNGDQWLNVAAYSNVDDFPNDNTYESDGYITMKYVGA